MCLIKDMSLWSIATSTNIWVHGQSRACARTHKLARARALLASRCQPDDSVGDYSSESED